MIHSSTRRPLSTLLTNFQKISSRQIQIPPPHSSTLHSRNHLSPSSRQPSTQIKNLSRMSAATSAPEIPKTPAAKWPEPENWPAAKVRQTYIDYFANSPGFEHTFWPSSGVIPFDDDTLLFANAVSRHYSQGKGWQREVGQEWVHSC